MPRLDYSQWRGAKAPNRPPAASPTPTVSHSMHNHETCYWFDSLSEEIRKQIHLRQHRPQPFSLRIVQLRNEAWRRRKGRFGSGVLPDGLCQAWVDTFPGRLSDVSAPEGASGAGSSWVSASVRCGWWGLGVFVSL